MAGPWEQFAEDDAALRGAGGDPGAGRLRIHITGGQVRSEEPPEPAEEGPWRAFSEEAPQNVTPTGDAADAGLVDELGRQAGLTGRYLVEGALSLPALIANAPAALYNEAADLVAGEGNGYRFPDQMQAVSGLLTEAGLPNPEGGLERVVGDASRAVAGAGGFLKAVQRAAQSVDPLIRSLGETLMQQPWLQSITAATGSAAGSATREAGGGPAAELAATLVGGLAPVAAVSAPAAAAARLRAGVAGDAPAVLAAAERQGIRILPQDIGGSGIQRETQAAAQSTFGADKIDRAVNQLYDDFRNRVREIAGDAPSPREVGEALQARSAQSHARSAAASERTSGAVQGGLGAAVDETAAGQVAQKGVSAWMRKTEEVGNKLREKIPIKPAAPATLTNTRQALAEMTAGIRSNPELSRLMDNPRLRAYFHALSPKPAGYDALMQPQSGGALDWEGLSRFRSAIGEVAGEARMLGPDDTTTAQLRRLYGALSRDMEATAKAHGPDAYKAWKRANDYWHGRMKRIEQTLSLVTGEKTDKTANEAFSAIQGLLKRGAGGEAAAFERIMRSLPKEDAQTIRASIVAQARGGAFDPQAFARDWAKFSERGKQALLPEPGMRDLMDDAAARADLASRDPLAGKSGEQVFADLERMAENRGDSAKFKATLSALSPEEASAARSLIIHRMGLAKAGAQNAEGDAFSISQFLTRWNQMSTEAKSLLFGNAEMRRDMDDLAFLAERVKESERMIGRSNSGAILTANATTGGLGAAAVSALSGNLGAAALFASPAIMQYVRAEMLTSPRFLRWLAAAPKKPNPAAMRAHVARLSSIAASEPAIANEVHVLQQRLSEAFTAPTGGGYRVAASPSGAENQPENR